MRRTLLLVLFSSFLVSSLFAWGGDHLTDFRDATPEELSLKGVPFAPGASAAVLLWVQRSDDNTGKYTEYLRIKIFSDEGKKYGNIELPYVRGGFLAMGGITARVIQPDGKVVPFTGKIYDKLIVKAGGVRVMAKTFSLPDVQAGSIIEYRYDRSWDPRILLDTHFTVQRELPVVKEMLWLKSASQGIYSTFFTYRDLPPGKKPEKVSDHYELELTEIGPYEEERYSPPDEVLKPSVDFFYTSDKIEAKEFWNEQAKTWSETVEDFIGDRSGIRKAAAEITAGATTQEEKLRKIYDRVQQLRNLSYEDEKTEQEARKLRDNRHVEDVWRNGYGYRSELSRLFVALARGAGFEAYELRIAPRDDHFFAVQLPIARQLSTEVALVTVDGQPRCYDVATPYAPFGMLSWENAHVSGMKLAKKTTEANWMETPAQAATDAVTRRTADLRADGDVLKGTVTVTWLGQEALVRRLLARDKDEAARNKQLEEEAKKWFAEGATVKAKSLQGATATGEPLVATFDVELPNLASNVGSRSLVPLSVFAASQKNPFAPEQRKYPIYLTYAYQVADSVTLHLPEGYGVESLPKSQQIDAGVVKYETKYASAGDAVTLNRQFTVSFLYLDKAKYPQLRNIFDKVTTADQEQLVLRKAAATADAKSGATR